ncbi:hypothetical protein SAMN04489713_105105 [Actinomadura madurae]|uniref:TNT domain-containing protein n=1 Tax=Actinomadura madurae TaxID=1993 RepID=A0A1I5GA11_9ACTN|nr:glycohydrolase toxin TNT-related protein [Actinomadura madurae]SFO32840.1 hypothetical protein SAMN04489713_105105 [Actinomadura madurae]
MTQDDERLNEIASLLARLAPDGSKTLKFAYRAVGSSFEQAFIPDGMTAAEARLPQSGIYPLLRHLRARMYEDGDGTWLEMDLTVRSRPEAASLADDDAPAWEVRYRSVDEITFADEITPLAAFEEMRMFPQEARRVPRWMGALASVEDAVDRFDPHDFSPQDDLESALPDGLDGLFTAARERLLAVVPREDADRFLVGRLADGCWSIVHAPPAWAAVRMENGESVEKHAYAGPVAAVAFAAGAVLAEAGAEVNSSVLRGAGALSRVTDRKKGVDAWTLPAHDKNGSRQVRRSMAAERPEGAATRGRRYLALSPLDNRHGGYFVVHPGPVPAQGDFVSTHQIFEWHVRSGLPEARTPAPAPAEEVVLDAGMELDTAEPVSSGLLFTLGTPFERRRLPGDPDHYSYRVYRVQRPITATPVDLGAKTFHRPGESGPKRLPDEQGQAFSLPGPIIDHLESGDLVEISGPGGAPVAPRDYWDTEEEP